MSNAKRINEHVLLTGFDENDFRYPFDHLEQQIVAPLDFPSFSEDKLAVSRITSLDLLLGVTVLDEPHTHVEA